MDEVWVEVIAIFEAIFVDVGKLVHAIVNSVSILPPNSALGPSHNQIHVLGNLLDLPVLKQAPYCHALSSLLPHDGTSPSFPGQ